MSKQDRVALACLAAYLIGIAVAGIHRPAWGDESHFVVTARIFGEQFGWTTLTHYEEMSTPLPFMLYGLWGAVLGFELGTLRILSLLIAGGTYVSFYRLVRHLGGQGYQSLGLTALLAMNPYMIGLSLFVFPDMLTIGFAILVMRTMLADRPLLAALANALGLLSKQYFLFVTLASCVALAFRYYKNQRQGGACCRFLDGAFDGPYPGALYPLGRREPGQCDESPIRVRCVYLPRRFCLVVSRPLVRVSGSAHPVPMAGVLRASARLAHGHPAGIGLLVGPDSRGGSGGGRRCPHRGSVASGITRHLSRANRRPVLLWLYRSRPACRDGYREGWVDAHEKARF